METSQANVTPQGLGYNTTGRSEILGEAATPAHGVAVCHHDVVGAVIHHRKVRDIGASRYTRPWGSDMSP